MYQFYIILFLYLSSTTQYIIPFTFIAGKRILNLFKQKKSIKQCTISNLTSRDAMYIYERNSSFLKVEIDDYQIISIISDSKNELLDDFIIIDSETTMTTECSKSKTLNFNGKIIKVTPQDNVDINKIDYIIIKTDPHIFYRYNVYNTFIKKLDITMEEFIDIYTSYYYIVIDLKKGEISYIF